MPKRKVYTTHEMTDRQKKDWEDRYKRGAAFKLDGAYGDEVYVPRSTSDTDPHGAKQRNRLRLRLMREIIDLNKGRRKQSYIA